MDGADNMQGSKTRYLRVVMSMLLLGVLAACSATYRTHGYVPSKDELANILVGVDTRGTVEEIIGRPSSMGMLEDGGWYYLSSRVRNYTYRQPEVIERELVAISFDGDGVVTNIERFGLEDGRVITLSRRVTESSVKGPGFISQLLGNFGNFDLGQALNN
jgi:outer membrane protein assembly factor BamE (lipoprotein component of BamABCDE complex)